jgi:salicylate hydroxylase
MTVPSKTKDFEIAIVGGGIAGLVLALALHNRGIPITVYERSAKFGEIGAGVSFTPNAVKAMKICYEGVYEGFERVCTRNMWSSKLQTYFDYVSSYEEGKVVDETIAFSTTTSLGQNAVHRAHFLDEMVKLVPPEKCIFNKHLINITQAPNGRQVMHFGDGTTAEADAIVGCDGIKSRVRATMYGADHPCVTPSFTNKIAYRGLVPMEKATEAIGAEFAQNAVMHVSGPA